MATAANTTVIARAPPTAIAAASNAGRQWTRGWDVSEMAGIWL
jgi:hypothetical protein